VLAVVEIEGLTSLLCLVFMLMVFPGLMVKKAGEWRFCFKLRLPRGLLSSAELERLVQAGQDESIRTFRQGSRNKVKGRFKGEDWGRGEGNWERREYNPSSCPEHTHRQSHRTLVFKEATQRELRLR
jgi:hypothetical protein